MIARGREERYGSVVVTEPYRSPEPPEPDRETPAIAELERRVRRARSAMIVGILAAALPLCLMGYVTVHEMQLASLGAANLYVNGFVGCGIPLLAAFKAADRLVPAVVSRLVARWLPEIAERHGVMLENLAEYTTHLR